MINPVTSATPATAAVPPKAATQQPAQSPSKTTPADTVTISAAKQILQESVETSAQTTKEAAGGDAQAKRLLAKEAAAHAPTTQAPAARAPAAQASARK
jgi:hypothetical protein